MKDRRIRAVQFGEDGKSRVRCVGHIEPLHALLYRLTLRTDVAEDLLQETFVRLLNSEEMGRPNIKIARLYQAHERAGYVTRVTLNGADVTWTKGQFQQTIESNLVDLGAIHVEASEFAR